MNNETDRTYEDVRKMSFKELLAALVAQKVDYAMANPELVKEILGAYFTELTMKACNGTSTADNRLGLINELYDDGYWA